MVNILYAHGFLGIHMNELQPHTHTPTSEQPIVGEYQARESKVSRRIWGNPEAIMLIFAGSAAEFAVNKAVDWLFWTEALPDAPIDRFFETVRFAQEIAFGDQRAANAAIQGVNRAHAGVERSRGARIPQWAYRDVLFMLIDYGERAHGVIYGPMNDRDRIEHFEASIALGHEMGIEGLPQSYTDYQAQRSAHLQHIVEHSSFTDMLYQRYRDHLGRVRMQGLQDVQASLVPAEVATLLRLKRKWRVDWLLTNYPRLTRGRRLRWLYRFMLPRAYAGRLASLERLA